MTRSDTVAKTKPPLEESVDARAEHLARAWSVSGVQSQPMERLSTILEITEAGADTTVAVVILVSLLHITPSSALLQSRQFLTPIIPDTTQSKNGSTTFKEYMERTIARMRAPPQEPPIERSRTAMPHITIQTMSFWIVGDNGSALKAMATSTGVVPQDARIGGLKLEMPEKYTGSLIPVVLGWVTKMERYFRLMKYPTDIWVDVIAPQFTNAAQAWLDKEFQDL